MADRAISTAASASQLSHFARVCAEHLPDPDMLDQIAKIFAETAAELRAQRRH